MSRTVSFRCSGELDEFLEQEAESRMTTKSTVAQMLLAEKVQELQAERSGEGGKSEQTDQGTETLPAGVDEPGGERDVLEATKEHWYYPDSDVYEYAVRLPDRDDRKYFKTEDGARKRLRREYLEPYR